MLSDRFTKVLEVAHFFISRSKKFCFEIRLKSKIFGADATFLFRKKLSWNFRPLRKYLYYGGSMDLSDTVFRRSVQLRLKSIAFVKSKPSSLASILSPWLTQPSWNTQLQTQHIDFSILKYLVVQIELICCSEYILSESYFNLYRKDYFFCPKLVNTEDCNLQFKSLIFYRMHIYTAN